MEFLFPLLVVLLILLVVVTVIGHGIWLMVAAVLRFLFSDDTGEEYERQTTRLFEPTVKPLDDLDITERQIVTFYVDGKLDERTYERLIRQIRTERTRLTPAAKVPASAPVPPPASVTAPVETPLPAEVPSVVTAALVASDDEIIIKPVPSFIADNEIVRERFEPQPRYEQPTPPPRPPRRPFSEVLNSFMEESNIRWGEIIGGLLIIGCSTALVVSLWAQISQIPVLKFLIFTTVTAILFGIGLVHRASLETSDHEPGHSHDRHATRAAELSRHRGSFSQQHFGRVGHRQRVACARNFSLPGLFCGPRHHARLRTYFVSGCARIFNRATTRASLRGNGHFSRAPGLARRVSRCVLRRYCRARSAHRARRS